MLCSSCGHDNPAGNAFCSGCGAALSAVCGGCAMANPPDNAFCGRCGRGLGAAAAADEPALEAESGERRQLTVLFCDLVGSTDLSARLDAEDYNEGLRAYYAAATEVLGRFGGYLAKHLGDGLLVYFGWPETYDDAAERAVRAALGIVEATATLQAGGAPLAVRVGLDTGAVVVGDVSRSGRRPETLAVGDSPNVAARVQSAAQPHQVVITAATHRLIAGRFVVEELGTRQLKGHPHPVELYRVLHPSGARGRLQAAAARGYTPFVNRSEERGLLRSRFERAAEGEGQFVLLSGEAGIGKSRLAQMLREEIADTPHTWLESGGASHYANTPFYAVAELLKQRSPWEDDTPEARSTALAEDLRRAGLDPAEALPWLAPLLDTAVRDAYRAAVAAPDVARKRLLATLAQWTFGTARLQPLVILIEDLHWVDPSSLELVQLLVEQGATASMLLLATARPQFHVPWPLRAHHTQLTLNRLPKRHVRDMVLGVAAQTALLAEVIDAVAARTDGVPLFVEELTKAVVEVGASAATRDIPATLVDSLMARLDRLGPQAKEVAQVGAVCGREFSFALIHAVHPLAAAELEVALAKLVDAELLHGLGLAPDATYTFKHALVQDAAYESLLKSRRRSLHGHIAAALTAHFGGLAAERPELVAHHYEAAAQTEPAISAWQQAGATALRRGALREAGHYLERGLALVATLPEGAGRDSYEFPLQLLIGTAHTHGKGYGTPDAAAAYARAMQVGERSADPANFLMLLIGLFISTLTRDGPVIARPLAERLLAAAESLHGGLARGMARFAVGLVDMYVGDLVAARDRFVDGLALYAEHADGGDVPVVLDLAIGLKTHLGDVCWQLGFPDQARRYMRDAVAQASASPRPMDREFAGHYAGILSALLRDPAEAATHAEFAAQVEQSNPTHAGVVNVIRGWCRAQAGDAGGIETLQAGIDGVIATGHHLSLERYHAFLADAYVQAGDLDAAWRALADGEQASFDQQLDRPGTLARRADLVAARAGASDAEVEAAFAEALAGARRHQARAYELRVATSYARWLCTRQRDGEAQAVLEPVYAAVSEGFDTRDVREAGALLETLDGADAASNRAATAAHGSR